MLELGESVIEDKQVYKAEDVACWNNKFETVLGDVLLLKSANAYTQVGHAKQGHIDVNVTQRSTQQAAQACCYCLCVDPAPKPSHGQQQQR